MSWKLTATAPRAAVEAAMARHEAGWPGTDELVITGYEAAPETPELWRLDAYFDARPGPADHAAVAGLFEGEAPELLAEPLPDADWLALSQQAVAPIRVGRFHVHTPDHPPLGQPGMVDFCIPAAQAFGTGHHNTTAGCLAMLDTMRKAGLAPRRIADIGTGTGLLAFAAAALWPTARITASDIDPICAPAVADNAARNGIGLGRGPGQVLMRVAPGLEDRVLAQRAPYDLLIANILAGPLIDLAADFAQATSPRASLLLSGLLVSQEAAVLAAYRMAGFRLHHRLHLGDWAVLWLRARYHG